MSIKFTVGISAFIILNALKFTWFSIWLVEGKSDWYTAKFIITFGWVGLAYLLIFKWKKRFAFILFYFAQCFFIYAHVSYFSFFQGILNFITQLTNLKEGLWLALEFAIPFDEFSFVILLDAPLFIFLLLAFKKIDIKQTLFRWGITLCLLFIIVQQTIFYFDEPIGIDKGVMDIRLNNMELVVCYGLIFHNIFDYWEFGQEKELIKTIKYGDPMFIDSQKKYNFVLIQVESLQAGLLETTYKGIPIMPNLVRYKHKYPYFPYMMSYHLGGHSADAEIAVINNVQPFKSTSLIYSKAYDYPNSFIRLLNKMGYSTKAFHNNLGWFFNRIDAYKKMDFDQFFHYKKIGYEDYFFGLPEKKMFDFMLTHIKKEKGAFCYYTITMSTHDPFESHKLFYANRNYEDVKDNHSKNMLISFSYVDEVISEFIEQIQTLDKNTFIFIFGDHTVYESKYIKSIRYKDGDRFFEYVPLIIIYPPSVAPKSVPFREKSVFSFHDIAPTILWNSGYRGEYRTFGGNLLGDKKINKSIPFLGKEFNRDQLFKKVNQLVTQTQ